MSSSVASRDKVLAVPAQGDEPGAARVGSFVGGLFRRVSVTILLAVGIAAGCGLGALWALYGAEQDAALTAQNERIMHKLSEAVIRGLEAVMLQGVAEAVDRYAERLKTVQGIADLRVLRTDGAEAFRDNQTVAAVNAHLGTLAFQPHERAAPGRAYTLSSPHFDQAVKTRQPVSYYETDEHGFRVMTVLLPMLNAQACQACHGGGAHAVRGVLKVTASLDSTDRAIEATRHKTLAALAGALAVILALTYALLNAVVVRRVQRVSDAMHAIVLGDYSTRVPEGDRDELGDMARSFNRMAENLLAASSQLNQRQDVMSAVLRGAHDGIVIADSKGNIIMANAAAEQLLTKPSQLIYKGGLARIFDNPALIQGWRGSLGDVAEEITYRGRPLQVYISRIRALDKADLGMAVLMRDISGERHLREEVKRLHFTDQQTGMGNARYLEHVLAHFWSRAKVSSAKLAVVLVSIDNLKEATLSRGVKFEELVVRNVAQLLAETFGKSVPLARQSEDTLAAVLYGMDAAQAADLALDALGRIHDTPVEGAQVWAGAGVAAAEVRAADGQAELLRAASLALRESIEAGSGNVRSAEPGAGT